MRVIFLITMLFTAALFAKPKENLKLQSNQLKFSYQNYDGDLYVHCTHAIENEASQDWHVTCAENSFKREYSVHLWITRYTKLNIPKTSYEMLYWVTEKRPQQKGYSSTSWIHLAEDSKFAGASLSVGVDEESAGLYLEVTP